MSRPFCTQARLVPPCANFVRGKSLSTGSSGSSGGGGGSGPHLHHQRRVGGGGHAARRKVDHRQAAQRLGLPHQLHGGAQLLRLVVQGVVYKVSTGVG